MRIIDTRIETMQIELLEASKEITTDEECLGFLLFDLLKGKLYHNPEDLLTDYFGSMFRMAMADNCNFDCDGSTFLRMSVVIDAFSRDKGESRFSICDNEEVNDALINHRKMKEKEANNEEANKEEANKEDDGFTMIEGMPYKANKLVYHDIKKEVPAPNMTVVALTKNGCWFAGRFDLDTWKFKNGSDFDPGLADDEVVAWFKVPLLHKIQ